MDPRRTLERVAGKLLAAAKDAIVVADAQGRIRLWNAAAARLFDHTEGEALGQPLTILMPERLREAHDAGLRRLREGGVPRLIDTSVELVGRRRDGSEFPLELSLSMTADEPEAMFTGIIRDISDRKRAEALLRESEERFRLLVEQVSDYAIFMLDPDGRVASWNAGARRLLGYAASEALGLPYAATFPPEAVAAGRPEALLRGAAAQGRSEDEGWRVRKDGARFVARVVLTALRGAGDDALRGFALVTHDVTEQVTRAEREARLLTSAATLLGDLDHEARLRSAARLAIPHVGECCIVDLALEDGALRRVAVLHSDPAKAALAAELERLAPDPAAPRGIAQAIRSGEPVVIPEVGARSPLGDLDPRADALLRELGIGSWLILPLRARGRTLGALTFGHARPGGLTAAELPFARAFAQIAALAADDALLFRQAQDAVSARDDFLSVASHELRTPLSTLRLVVDFLLHVPGDLPVERLQSARRQVDRLVRLVEQLLDVSRISAGRLSLEPEDVDLARVVRDVVEREREALARARCPVRLELAEASGRWDRLRLDQVITNLLTNAMKYGAGQPIEVTLEVDDSTARLSVRDRGGGIAPADQARIFERFERAAPRAVAGLGLGLWIVRQILAAMGGTVRVESAPGAGACFTVELPRRPSDGALARPGARADEQIDHSPPSLGRGSV